MRASAQELLAKGVVKSQADALQHFGPGDIVSPIHWSYRLGPQTMPVDYWWLDLQFDEQGMVIGCRVRAD